MAREFLIDRAYLFDNPDHIFVFGDNTVRKGKGGAAALRDMPNTHGFITKKFPSNKSESFYTVEEYKDVFDVELINLERAIKADPSKTFIMSKVGAGLANKHGIWENVIRPLMKIRLRAYAEQIEYLW